jgi:hypothetical protein
MERPYARASRARMGTVRRTRSSCRNSHNPKKTVKPHREYLHRQRLGHLGQLIRKAAHPIVRAFEGRVARAILYLVLYAAAVIGGSSLVGSLIARE